MGKDNPVRVLAIVYQMGRGGMESRLMDILRNIDYKKISVDIFTCCREPGEFDEEVKKIGGMIYYNPKLTLKNMFWYISYFKKFLLQHPEYQIIHAHQNAWCTVFCKGAKLAGVPIRIAHSRTAISTHSIKDIAKNIIKIPTKYYATHYFAVSDLAGQWLFGKKNMEEGKVQIWKNAIACSKYRFNPERREMVRKQFTIQDDEKVIMHVGNFREGKNQIFLPEVFKAVKSKTYALLIFVGEQSDKKYFDRVQSKVRKLGLDKSVKFLGKRNDVEDLLQAADVFCCPSFFEGMPGAVLEAQASGLPCIISSEITKEAIILNSTKALDLKQPAEVWADAIIEGFSAARQDTYEEMVKAGFDIEDLVNELTKFYISTGEK